MDYLSIILFVVASCITPGPNNIMLLSSGANYGFVRTIPHILGINVGVALIFCLVALGLGNSLQQGSFIYTTMQALSLLYLIYLAFKVATASQIDVGNSKHKPLTPLQAALFQWLNPKAWMMVTGAYFAYSQTDRDLLPQAATIGSIFFMFGLPCSCLWTLLGKQINSFLSNERRRLIFNISMALLLLLSVVPALLQQLLSAISL